jgi:hypothetical protein
MNLIKSLNKWFLFSFFMLVFGLISSFENNISISSLFISVCYLIFFYIIVTDSIIKKRKKTSDLIFTCTFFSLFFLLLFKTLYYFETGFFFEFSAVDSLQYHEFALNINKEGFWRGVANYIRNEDVEDLGAVFITSLAYQIYPSTIILNIFNVIAGIITVTSLYRLSLFFMSKNYAYYTALIYGLSSFVIYLYSTGMKETFFVMFIILFFEFLTKFVKKRNFIYLIISIVFLLNIFFFRPAVAFMIIFAIFSSLIYINRKGLLGLFLIVPSIIFAINFFIQDIDFVIERYYGSVEVVSARAEYSAGITATKFNYIVSYISGFFGPLPTYTPVFGRLQQYFYAIAIGLRVFLSIFFWFGFLKLIKEKNFILLAVSFFVILEMFSLSLILQSFELRFNSPHLIFIYIISFYWLNNKRQKSSIKVFEKKIISLYFIIATLMIVYWNYRFFVN